MLRSFLSVLGLVAFTGVLCAQSTSASLSGRVTDAAKARIVAARVTIVSSDTNIRYQTETSAVGEYALTNLPPGRYRMEVEKADFKTLVKPDVILHVQDALAIDFEMQVGPASETIRVESGAPLINTESATVSTLVDSRFVEDLPLNGRSFQTLILLTPGMVVTPTAFDDQGQFSVNGQRADANYFTVDGVSGNFGVTGYLPLVQGGTGALPALSASGGTNSLVSVDAMQEFRVQTSSFAPEFGRTPGAQISIVTRSGTNAFHGSLFEYFRNDVLDANNWFNGYTNVPPLPKAKDRQNDFGGVFGGPLIKDKTFFFFSYEGLRLRQPSTQETAVPDDASRQQAPASLLPYLNAYPVANGAELNAGLAQFNAAYSNPSSLNATSIRLDQVINSRFTLFGRYDYSPSSLSQRAPNPRFPVLSTIQSESSSVQTLTVGLTALLTPAVSNEVRVNYSNDRVGSRFGLDNFGGAIAPEDSLLFPAGFSSAKSLFEFLILGSGELSKGPFGTSEQRQFNLIDNLSVTRSGHRMKFGIDYRWLSPFASPYLYSQFAAFTGVTASAGGALSGTTAFADTTAYEGNSLLVQNFSLYGQDTWKATPRLTLTYGLRWDVNPPPRGKNSTNDPFTVTGLDDPSTIALAPRGTPLYLTTFGNFAPRIGFAYQFGDRSDWASVLRGGFGVFYDLGYGSLGGVSSYFPYLAEHIASASTTPCASGLIGVCFPLTAPNAAAPEISTNLPAEEIIVAKPDLRLPRTYEWNVAIEQSLGKRQSLSATYVGAVGRDLLRTTNLVSPNANFAFVNVTDNLATSDYHALQIKFQRNLSRGLQALASYTYSHSIDIASTDAFANYLNTPASVANPNIDRGNSDFDVRHAVTGGVTYNLPSPEWNNVAHAALGGWSVDGFIFARSAPPQDIVGGISFASGIALAARPDVVRGVPLELYASQYPGGKIFNSAAFTAPPAGQQGDFGRNVLRAFGGSQADIAFQRKFHFSERMQLRFRGEFFNILNHPNFGPPNNMFTSSLFGYSTQTLANSLGSGGPNGGLNPLYQIGGPRSIQLALKLEF